MPNQHRGDEQRAKRERHASADDSGDNKELKKTERKPRSNAYITNQAFRWITLSVDVLVFAAVSIYSFFAYQQWQAMNGQLLEMRKATKATADSIALTRDMSRLDQRAWVATYEVTGDLDVGQPFIAHVMVKNTGKTFARNVQVRTFAEIVKKFGEPNFDRIFSAPQDAHGASLYILAPNAASEGTSDQLEGSPFSQEQIDNIRDNQDLFVYGRISYADVFDRDHWTEFCFRYNVKNRTYEYHDKHNDVDNRSGD